MSKNCLVTEIDINLLLNKFGNIGDNGEPLKVKDIEIYKKVFVPREYLEFPDANITYIARESWDELEFIGDSVLGYVCAFEMYDKFKGQGEGVLTKMKSGITRGDHIATYGLELELNKHMLCSKVMEMNSAINVKYSRFYVDNLEDMFEALLGAIILDNGGMIKGLVYATRFIKNLIDKFVNLQTLYESDLDPKGTLINLCTSVNIKPPIYPKVRIRAHTDTLYAIALNKKEVTRAKLMTDEEIEKLEKNLNESLWQYRVRYPPGNNADDYFLIAWSQPWETVHAVTQVIKHSKKKNDLIQNACREALERLTHM